LHRICTSPDETAEDEMSSATDKARALVEAYLEASMIPDPVKARSFVAPDVRITFTGGRRFADPAGSAGFNAKRYRWVKKRFERTDVVAGASEEEATVYNIGTLYGEWPDGTPFEGNRYVDRFELRGGKITRMDVWNDSAEILLARAGLSEDGIEALPAARPERGEAA
jgi:ketosteroid isomerase-like protein